MLVWVFQVSTLSFQSSSLRLPDKFAMVFDRHRHRELLLLDAGPLCHLWDVDVVFDTDGHMYLALTILAI